MHYPNDETYPPDGTETVPLLTEAQVARRCDVSGMALGRLVAAGRLRADFSAGKYRLYRGDRVDEIRGIFTSKPHKP